MSEVGLGPRCGCGLLLLGLLWLGLWRLSLGLCLCGWSPVPLGMRLGRVWLIRLMLLLLSSLRLGGLGLGLIRFSLGRGSRLSGLGSGVGWPARMSGPFVLLAGLEWPGSPMGGLCMGPRTSVGRLCSLRGGRWTGVGVSPLCGKPSGPLLGGG